MATARGPQGETGKAGKEGPAGKTGPRGPAGPAGPKMSRTDVIAVVEDQFYDLRKRLDIQLERTSQLQAEIDAQRKETARILEQVELVHALLKKLTHDA